MPVTRNTPSPANLPPPDTETANAMEIDIKFEESVITKLLISGALYLDPVTFYFKASIVLNGRLSMPRLKVAVTGQDDG